MTAAPRLEHGLDVDDGTRVRWTSYGRQQLVAWLAKHDVRTDALGKDIGVSGAAIRKLTSGASKAPELEQAFAIQKRTGISPEAWLIDRSSIVTLVAGHRGKVQTMPNEKEIAEKLARDGSAAGGELLRSGVAEAERTKRDNDQKAADQRAAKSSGANPLYPSTLPPVRK